jgi:hypothetical protein
MSAQNRVPISNRVVSVNAWFRQLPKASDESHIRNETMAWQERCQSQSSLKGWATPPFPGVATPPSLLCGRATDIAAGIGLNHVKLAPTIRNRKAIIRGVLPTP